MTAIFLHFIDIFLALSSRSLISDFVRCLEHSPVIRTI